MADTKKAIEEINEIIRLAIEKIGQEESIGIELGGRIGKLTIDNYTSVDFKKAIMSNAEIDEAILRNIHATAPSELKQILPLLEELKTMVTLKEKNPKFYEKIADKFIAFGSWAKVVLDILHYTGHI
jgi:hypothetical protein